MAGLPRAAAGYCLPEPHGAPPRAPLPPSARPRRFECCESNVGFVTFRCRRGQFLKGQRPAAAQTGLRPAPPPAPGGPGLREADRAWASRGRRRRTDNKERAPEGAVLPPDRGVGRGAHCSAGRGLLKGPGSPPSPLPSLAVLDREQRSQRVAWRPKVSRGQSPNSLFPHPWNSFLSPLGLGAVV